MTENKPSSVKQYKELDKVQQELFVKLASVIETHAKEYKMDTKQGVYRLLEMLVTLTLSVKSLYLLKKPEETS